MESGRLPLSRIAVDALDLLRRAADVAHSMATAVHISLQVKAAPAMVFVDAERALQVLNELISNAIKFSPPDTVIRLGTQSAPEGEVCFVVEDEGRGIAQALFGRACNVLTDAGCRRMWLTTWPGTRAERFYRKAGWRMIGTLGAFGAVASLPCTRSLA